MDISYIKPVVSHAAAVHGVRVQVEPIDLARIALKRLGLVGKGRERDRRPALDELQALADYFASKSRQIIPLGRIMRFGSAPRCAFSNSRGGSAAGRPRLNTPPGRPDTDD